MRQKKAEDIIKFLKNGRFFISGTPATSQYLLVTIVTHYAERMPHLTQKKGSYEDPSQT